MDLFIIPHILLCNNREGAPALSQVRQATPFYMLIYCKNSLLKRNTQTQSSQPIITPEGMVTRMHMISLKRPPFLVHVDHLTITSVNQLIGGIRSKRILTNKLCFLNHVITYVPPKFIVPIFYHKFVSLCKKNHSVHTFFTFLTCVNKKGCYLRSFS